MKNKIKIALVLICCMVMFTTLLAACDILLQKVTVTYDPNYEGATLQKQTVEKGTVVVPPTNITREGYSLEGWYKDADCTQAIASTGYKVVTNITFYAKWSSADPDTVTLTGISVEYIGGPIEVLQPIDKTNVIVTAYYSDDSFKQVTDFSISPSAFGFSGEQTVTVSYTENNVTKTRNFTVMVVESGPVVLESITAEYVGADLYIGDELNKSDIIVTAFYSDGSRKTVTDFIIGWYDTSTLGIKRVTIYVPREDGGADLYADITVRVVAKLESIEVEYTGGDLLVDLAIDKTKITVTAFYDDGSSKPVSGYTLSETSFATTGEKTLTVTYVENGITRTNTFTVKVVVATLERIEAVYNGGMVLLGEQPNIKHLVVTAYYDNGLSRVVTNVNVGTIDSATEGEKDWEISYTDNGVTKSVIVKITVTESKEPREGDYDVNVIKNENLSIHFLMLGNKYTGDSVYIKAGDTDILIDAGSRESSASTIANYVNQYCTDGILEYVIATHAHQDHISGFYRSSSNGGGIFDRYQCNNIIQFARTGQSETTNSGNRSTYGKYVDARNAQAAAGANVFTALDCVNNVNGAQKVFDLTGDGSITMEILYQEYYSKNTSNENNYSVCLMISQGDNHYLFTGDLEGEGETSLVNNNPNLPEMELWKGGHHGSFTAASTELMSKIKPKCVCVCTCMGTSEYTTGDHAFPAQEFCDRVAPYTDRVYVTTYMIDYSNGSYQPANGNIVFACTNGQITMYFSGNNLKLKDTDWFKANRTCPDAWKN